MQPTIDSTKMQTNIEFTVLNSWKHAYPKSNQALRRQSWINLDTMWTNLTILKIGPVNVFVVFQSLSDAWLCDPMDGSTPGLPVLHHLLESTQTPAHWVNDAISSCHPLLLLPSIFSSIRVFSNELAHPIRWPKYWSFRFSISPSSEYSGLISFRTDSFDLAVQGILKSLLQHHSWKASVLRRSAFFMVQLSHLYVATRKTIALTR